MLRSLKNVFHCRFIQSSNIGREMNAKLIFNFHTILNLDFVVGTAMFCCRCTYPGSSENYKGLVFSEVWWEMLFRLPNKESLSWTCSEDKAVTATTSSLNECDEVSFSTK